MAEKALFTWSGGKDSALALYHVQQQGDFEITALLTTITGDYNRVSMHGFRTELLEQQVASLDYELDMVRIPKDCTKKTYEKLMQDTLEKYKTKGVQKVIFGDIFLEDVRKYRENNLKKIGMEGIFPLWLLDTKELANEFIDLSFKAVITCVDSEMLAGGFVGRVYDKKFLAELPDCVDPCGEHGEFHTFVYDGPGFDHSIDFVKGEVVLREERYYFVDLMMR